MKNRRLYLSSFIGGVAVVAGAGLLACGSDSNGGGNSGGTGSASGNSGSATGAGGSSTGTSGASGTGSGSSATGTSGSSGNGSGTGSSGTSGASGGSSGTVTGTSGAAGNSGAATGSSGTATGTSGAAGNSGAATGSSGTSTGTSGSTGAADGGSAATFTEIYTTIMVPTCLSCHAPGPPQPLLQGNLDLSTQAKAYANLVNYPSTCLPNGGTRVVPGNPAESLLYSKVSTMMPFCGAYMPFNAQNLLPAAQIEMFASWIDAGAPND